jgi:hypothetical protein
MHEITSRIYFMHGPKGIMRSTYRSGLPKLLRTIIVVGRNRYLM